MKIALVSMRWCKYGGWPTFKRHLFVGLTAAGAKVTALSVESPAGARGWVQKLKGSDALDHFDWVIVDVLPTAKVDNYDLLLTVAKVGRLACVIHDPTEFQVEVLRFLRTHQPPVIFIRPAVLEHTKARVLHRVVCLPHPYKRSYVGIPELDCRSAVVSTSRVDYDKNTHLILEAACGIQIHTGHINRMYEYHTLRSRFGLLKQSADYHGSFGNAATVLKKAFCLVDMSTIAGDGGGTQYTLLEAMDRGLWLVLHQGWFTVPDSELRVGEHCVTVQTAGQLRDVVQKLRDGWQPYDRGNYLPLLKRHGCRVVCRSLLRLLTGEVDFERREILGFFA